MSKLKPIIDVAAALSPIFLISSSDSFVPLAIAKMSTLSELPSYTLIHVPSDSEVPSEQQLKADLENGDVRTKTAALKKTILMILNGEKINNVVSL